MTALAADRDTAYQVGDEIALPVAASEVIYLGGLVCLNTSGYAVAAANTAGLLFMGVAAEQADNSAGSNGDVSVRVMRKGIHQFVAAGLAITDVGQPVYVTDDQTVSMSPGSVRCGKLAKFSTATVAHVDIEDVAESAAGNAGGIFTICGFHPGTVGTSTVVVLDDLELPTNFVVLAGFADALVAPSSTYTCTLTITDGVTPKTVVITGTAKHGENKTINTEYDANTDMTISLIESNGSALTEDVSFCFVCRAI